MARPRRAIDWALSPLERFPDVPLVVLRSQSLGIEALAVVSGGDSTHEGVTAATAISSRRSIKAGASKVRYLKAPKTPRNGSPHDF